MTLGYQITNSYESINISKEDVLTILDTASWKIDPKFPQPGRSAWISLTNPIPWNNILLISAKIKGIGIANPKTAGYSGIHNEPHFDTPRKPAEREYTYTGNTQHVGFDNQGNFSMVKGEPTPFGGMLHNRAVNEFQRLKSLSENSGMASVPAFTGKYDNLYFQGKPLGFCVSLYSAEYPYRLNHLLSSNLGYSLSQRDFSIKAIKCLGFSSEIIKKDGSCNLTSEIYKRAGIAMRKFSLAGLYRHSGGIDNFLYCLETDDALITDVDASLELSTLPKKVQALQLLRDFASVVYKLYKRIGHPDYINNFPISQLTKYNPLRGLLIGYFPELSGEDITNIENKISPYHLNEFMKLNIKSLDFSQFLDRKISFVISILSTYKSYSSSKYNNFYPQETSYPKLYKNAMSFLGEPSNEMISSYLNDI